MRRRRLDLWSSLTLLLVGWPAVSDESGTAEFFGHTLNYELPAGYCALDGQAKEEVVAELSSAYFLRQTAYIVLFAVDCAALDAQSGLQSLMMIGYVPDEEGYEPRQLSGSRSELIAALASRTPEQIGAKVLSVHSRELPLLETGEDAVYFGQDGQIVAHTMVNAMGITVWLNDPGGAPDVLLGDARVVMNRLVGLNGTLQDTEGHARIDWRAWIIKGAAVLALAVLAWSWRAFRARRSLGA